jgi:hypothetical protein
MIYLFQFQDDLHLIYILKLNNNFVFWGFLFVIKSLNKLWLLLNLFSFCFLCNKTKIFCSVLKLTLSCSMIQLFLIVWSCFSFLLKTDYIILKTILFIFERWLKSINKHHWSFLNAFCLVRNKNIFHEVVIDLFCFFGH